MAIPGGIIARRASACCRGQPAADGLTAGGWLFDERFTDNPAKITIAVLSFAALAAAVTTLTRTAPQDLSPAQTSQTVAEPRGTPPRAAQLTTPGRWILQGFEYKFYYCSMSSLAPDRLLVTPIIAPTTPSTPGWRLTAEEEATAVAELKQAAAGWAALLAECAGLALGYGEHQLDALRYRHIAELCVAAGVDQTLVEAWIEVGRQRAGAAAVTTHRACVFWDS